MAKGGYLGGSTLLRPGSDWFGKSRKGGSRRRKLQTLKLSSKIVPAKLKDIIVGPVGPEIDGNTQKPDGYVCVFLPNGKKQFVNREKFMKRRLEGVGEKDDGG